MKVNATTPEPTRSGFTLLELLMVVVIISIIAALLIVAFGGVLRSADVTKVKAEFTQIESAMKKFESDYGVIPPSAIVLTEDPGTTAWDATSKTVLRRMFGNTIDWTASYDFNGDSVNTGDPALGDGRLILTSSECLLFFLGGVRSGTTFTGFSGNKEKPFASGGDNRVDPQFTFDPSRLIDEDEDGMPEYKDLASDEDIAIIFASSNNGQGYSDTDGSVAHYHQSDGSTPWNQNSFQLISAGADGAFGFDVEPNPFVVLTWSADSTVSGAEADNITNFAPGTLGQ